MYTFDSRTVAPGDVFVALKGEKADGHDFIPMALERGAAEVIDGLEALQTRAREYRRTLKAKVIGITGSAGKTTTKELLRAFLSQLGKTHATAGNFNNHLGLPLTILNCPSDAEFLVLEMGTNHPGEIAALCDIAEPEVGLLTNIGTAHLEFFRTREGIAAEKGTLLRRAALAFAASDNGFLPGTVDAHLEWMREALDGILPGEHNVTNASLAFAVAAHFGLTRDGALAALKDFALPGERWRRVERDGIVFIDDTYNANPDAMIAALDALVTLPTSGRRVAILGDMLELGETSAALHQRVFAHARDLKLPLIIGVGPNSSACPCDRHYPNAAALKGELSGLLRTGDTVLLKASHSMHLGDLL